MGDLPSNRQPEDSPADLPDADPESPSMNHLFVSYEDYVTMRDRLQATKEEILRLREANHQQCNVVNRLLRQVAFMDELEDDPSYVCLRELEDKVLKVIKIVSELQEDFKSLEYVRDHPAHQAFLDGLMQISCQLDDCEPDLFLSHLFTDMQLLGD